MLFGTMRNRTMKICVIGTLCVGVSVAMEFSFEKLTSGTREERYAAIVEDFRRDIQACQQYVNSGECQGQALQAITYIINQYNELPQLNFGDGQFDGRVVANQLDNLFGLRECLTQNNIMQQVQKWKKVKKEAERKKREADEVVANQELQILYAELIKLTARGNVGKVKIVPPQQGIESCDDIRRQLTGSYIQSYITKWNMKTECERCMKDLKLWRTAIQKRQDQLAEARNTRNVRRGRYTAAVEETAESLIEQFEKEIQEQDYSAIFEKARQQEIKFNERAIKKSNLSPSNKGRFTRACVKQKNLWE